MITNVLPPFYGSQCISHSIRCVYHICACRWWLVAQLLLVLVMLLSEFYLLTVCIQTRWREFMQLHLAACFCMFVEFLHCVMQSLNVIRLTKFGVRFSVTLQQFYLGTAPSLHSLVTGAIQKWGIYLFSIYVVSNFVFFLDHYIFIICEFAFIMWTLNHGTQFIVCNSL